MKKRVSTGVWVLMAAVFALTSFAAGGLFYYLRNYERNQAEKMLKGASETLQDRVQSELDQETNALQRIAGRWKNYPDMAQVQWNEDVKQVLEDHQSLLAIGWLENEDADSPDLEPAAIVRKWAVTWSYPVLYDPAVKKLHSLIEQNRIKLLEEVYKDRRMKISEPILVADRGKMFAVYIPTIVDGRIKGVTLGLFHVQVLMTSIFERLLAKDYSIKLMDGYSELITLGDPKNNKADWEYNGTLKTFNSAWEMSLWPNPERQKNKERLAWFVLGGGILFGSLLSLMVFFFAMRSDVSAISVIPVAKGEAPEIRRKIEDRLRVWEAAISNIDEAIFVAETEVVLGTGNPILFVNTAFEKLTGLNSAELIGKTPRILFQNSSDKSGYDALRDAMQKNQASVMPVTFARKGEEAQTYDLRVKPVSDGLNRITHYVLMLKPQAVEAPAAIASPVVAAVVNPPAEAPLPAGLSTAALLEALLSDTPLAVQVLDAAGYVISWNKLAEEVTGYSSEEVLSHETPVKIEFPAAGVWHRQELKLKRKNGTRMDLNVWTAPLRDPSDESATVSRWMSFMVDVTQQNLAQEELAQRELSFRSLVENASDILAVLDLQTAFHYINPAVEQVLGFTAADLIGTKATDLVQASDVPAARKSLEEAITSGSPSRPRTLHVRHQDGSLREIESVINLIQGSPLAVMNARDVTGRTRSEVPEVSPAWFLNAVQDAIVTYDTEHRVIWMNRAAEDLYNLSSTFAQGKTIGELLPDWLQVPSHEQIREALDNQGYFKGEVSNYTPSGKEIVQDVSITSTYDSEKRRIGAVAIHRDITEKKTAIEAMRADEKTKTLDALGNSDGLWDWNIRTDEVYFSPRWKEMLGYNDQEIAGDLGEWEMMVHPDDLTTLRTRIQAHLHGHSEHLEAEYRIRTKAGDYRWMMTRAMAVRNAEGEPSRLVGLQVDIHDQKEMEEQLLFEAFHDSVTGLANRALFLDRVNGLLARGNQPFTVAFMDLEKFAAVNEALGTRGGDKALADAGKRVTEALPKGSFVARHSSDEFVALVPTVEESELRQISDLLRYQLAKPFEFQGKTVSSRLNLGFALSTSRPYSSGEDMLQDASRVMAATRLGKTESPVFTPATVHAEAAESIEQSNSLEQQMRNGMANGEFRVFYHPIITLETGEIAGVEALVRWQHPTRGLLTPQDFLSVAETSGIILELDRWVLSEACAKANEMNQRFRRAESLILTVNLSSLHFADDGFTGKLEEILSASSINPHYLRIEIAGRIVMNDSDPEAMLRNFGRLRVQLNLDDFNDTADSLANLSRLPVDRVKIDSSLVRGLSSGRNLEKVRSIIGAAKANNIEVVAEGVETLEQLAVLRELKCHLAQGFYFTQPATANDTERLLARSPRW